MVMVIAFSLMMTRTAAVLAERTGLGEAVKVAIFVAASTSLPEIATSVTAAFEGHADLALSNVICSVAGQSRFLRSRICPTGGLIWNMPRRQRKT
jgi:cation:H+ antiporter